VRRLTLSRNKELNLCLLLVMPEIPIIVELDAEESQCATVLVDSIVGAIPIGSYSIPAHLEPKLLQTTSSTCWRMQIAGYEFSAYHVAVVDLSAANDTLAQPMDIVLGYPSLRQANWYCDVPQRLWSVTRLYSESSVQ
jgi:hypothetical protein